MPVAEVDGPAQRAGLRPKDVITQVNGRPILNDAELTAVMETFRPGNGIRVTFHRGNRVQSIDVTLGEKQKSDH